ncbi:RDD family protein [Chryseobacterium sp. Ch-15]|uniref:RDD family protein n=1 Tax=Chryseobacterium muglaense TaxID=2893752 RepID=A0A9Q3YT08_9FLAO|nr:RDD family protein [Chryseobacterium muglaense]MBD3907220.1 RDD family protein [Chryseobacterium muglaense]MCC9036636.1 RDD family protein [Chryseobacterium muglaense]MCM2556915.1 RDD family protein [Chryseobacterium muglaense]
MGKNYKLIAISSMVVSVIGIFCSFYTFYGIWKGASGFNTVPELVRFLFSFSVLNLNFTNKFDHLEIWNFVFYVLLLIGALQFIKTKGKETRLVGFVFSVIFLETIVLFAQSILHKTLVLKWENSTSLQIFYGFFGFIILGGVSYLSYRILKIIKSQKEIDIIKTEEKTTVTDTGKWQRFFHWMIDLAVMALIFVPVVTSWGYWLMESQILRTNESLAIFLQSRLSLYVIVFVFFFIYYPVSEIIFGSSPAKFLTESRVVNSKAEAANAPTIFLRTLCRNIPFDALSFFSKRGWHDSLSETYVVKEKRTGFKTNRLLWILPVLAIYLLLMYFGKSYYADYKASVERKETLSNQFSLLKSEIKNPNTSQFYVVQNVDYYGNIKNYGFKIEKIEGDDISIRRITGDHFSDSNYSQAKQLYEQQKDTAQIFIIKKQELVKIFPESMEELYRPIKTIDFFKSGIQYGIENVYDFDAPHLMAQISKDDNDYTNKKVTLYLHNIGKSGTITNIKNQNNKIKWNAKFPLKLKEVNAFPLIIPMENYDFTESNISTIEVLDSLNKKHSYIIKTSGLTNEIKEIK